jgi:hypothetical protein
MSEQPLASYPIAEIMPLLTQARADGKRSIWLPSGNRLRISRTLQLFVEKGTKCVSCGLEGHHFVEIWLDTPKDCTLSIMNLYGMRNGGRDLMTLDHIVPKSKGGNDTLANGQPMCANCNGKKADKVVLPPERTKFIKLNAIRQRIGEVYKNHPHIIQIKEDLRRCVQFRALNMTAFSSEFSEQEATDFLTLLWAKYDIDIEVDELRFHRR